MSFRNGRDSRSRMYAIRSGRSRADARIAQVHQLLLVVARLDELFVSIINFFALSSWLRTRVSRDGLSDPEFKQPEAVVSLIVNYLVSSRMDDARRCGFIGEIHY